MRQGQPCRQDGSHPACCMPAGLRGQPGGESVNALQQYIIHSPNLSHTH